MPDPQDNWTPRLTLNRRFWVGCVVLLFSVSVLIATFITHGTTAAAPFPWGQTIVACLVFAVGARFVLSKGNLAALRARFL